jgi:hypothetical protein
MVKRRNRRRLLVDRFKGSLRIPIVLRAAFWVVKIIDVVLRAFDRLS